MSDVGSAPEMLDLASVMVSRVPGILDSVSKALKNDPSCAGGAAVVIREASGVLTRAGSAVESIATYLEALDTVELGEEILGKSSDDGEGDVGDKPLYNCMFLY